MSHGISFARREYSLIRSDMKKSHHRQLQRAIKRLFLKTWGAKNWAAIGTSGFLALGVNQLHAGSGPSDTIYLGSNSTAGNVIFTYTFDFTCAPTLKNATPAGEYWSLRPHLRPRSFRFRSEPDRGLKRFDVVCSEFGFKFDCSISHSV